MTLATYAPRVNVHGDRYGGVKTHGPNLWIVLHTSEQSGESTDSAERLASYMTQPGDRPNGRGGYYGSSYHAVFDTDRVFPCVPNNTVAYAAGGGNSRGVHGCFPGKAGQSRAEWLDDVSLAMIRTAARWIVDVCRSEGIPDGFISYRQVAAYEAGVCDHHAISLAFARSTHTDVGPAFPWDVLRHEIDALIRTPLPTPLPNPPMPGDETMYPDAYEVLTFTQRPGAFLVGPGGPVHLDGAGRDRHIAAGVKARQSDNEDVLGSYERVARGL